MINMNHLGWMVKLGLALALIGQVANAEAPAAAAQRALGKAEQALITAMRADSETAARAAYQKAMPGAGQKALLAVAALRGGAMTAAEIESLMVERGISANVLLDGAAQLKGTGKPVSAENLFSLNSLRQFQNSLASNHAVAGAKTSPGVNGYLPMNRLTTTNALEVFNTTTMFDGDKALQTAMNELKKRDDTAAIEEKKGIGNVIASANRVCSLVAINDCAGTVRKGIQAFYGQGGLYEHYRGKGSDLSNVNRFQAEGIYAGGLAEGDRQMHGMLVGGMSNIGVSAFGNAAGYLKEHAQLDTCIENANGESLRLN